MKKAIDFIQGVLRFISLSNLYISVCAFCLTYQSCYLFKVDELMIFEFSVFHFAAVYFIYNLQRFYHAFTHQKEPTTKDLFYKKHTYSLFILLIIICCFGYFKTSSSIALILCNWKLFVLPFLLAIFYFMPPLQLREKPFVKQFVVAFCWIYTCLFVPLFLSGQDFSFDSITIWSYLVSQFCFFVAICIPFDIRDFEIDKNKNVKSMPVLIGVYKAKLFATAFLLLFMLMSSLFFQSGSEVLLKSLLVLISIAFVQFSKPDRPALYYSIFGDGLIILQFLAFYFLTQ